jgi:hypothetical protein
MTAVLTLNISRRGYLAEMRIAFTFMNGELQNTLEKASSSPELISQLFS